MEEKELQALIDKAVEAKLAEKAAAAEAAKPVPAKPKERRQDVPVYRVTQEPGFPTGLQFYKPGDEIEWEVPEGWNAEKNGKHFAEYGPSITFDAVNDKAVAHMKAHKAQLQERNKPKPTGDPALLAHMIEMEKRHAESMAESRKLMERMAEALEAAQGSKSKK